MLKIKNKKIEKVNRLYDFYCDHCGEYIGTSEEYSDGFVEQLGKYETHIYIDGAGWFHYEATLCDKCKNKTIYEISTKLKDFGFEPDND